MVIEITWTVIAILLLIGVTILSVLARRQVFGLVLALPLALSRVIDKACSIWENIAQDESPHLHHPPGPSDLEM